MTIQGPEEPEPFTPSQPAIAEPVTRRRRFDPWTLVLGIVGGALLGTGVTFAILGSTGVFEEPTPTTNPPPPSVTVPPPTSAPPPLAATASATQIAQHAIPSIVAVEVEGLLGQSGGSGVVYGTDGYLITNDHVVEGADQVTVVFADGARYPAEIIGTDPLTDIAVLRVNRTDLTPMDIGDPSALNIGDMAVAIGNPLALVGGPSVTSGIISALDRWLEVEPGTFLYGLVQTDAPITHGSSGGALVDENARVVGITTAIAVSDIAAEGFGFAIPIDMATGVAPTSRAEVRSTM
jgi:putative serine protease PepD